MMHGKGICSMVGLLLAALLSAQTAFGGERWVETPPSETRLEAVRQLRTIVSEGYNARLVRRYRHGFGYEYIVQLTGFSSSSEAKQASETLARLLGVSVAVFEQEENDETTTGQILTAVESVSSVTELPFDSLGAVLEQLRWVSTRDELRMTVSLAKQIDFRYRQRDGDGQTEFRRYARDGQQEYLEWVVSGRRSAVWVDATQGWLALGREPIRMIDRTYAQRLVSAGSPTSVLGLGLQQIGDFLSPSLLSEARLGGLVDVGGDLCFSVIGEMGPSKMPISVAFEPTSFWVRQVVVGEVGRAWVIDLDAYHEEVNGMNLPHVIQVWFDGEIFFHINIDAINLIFEEKGGAGFVPEPR